MDIKEFIDLFCETWGLPQVQIKKVSLPGTMQARLDINSNTLELRTAQNVSITEELVFIISHELRHLWQKEQGWNFENYNSDTSDIDTYNAQVEEIDANAFGFLICDILFDCAPTFNRLAPHVRCKIYERALELDESDFEIFDDFAERVNKKR